MRLVKGLLERCLELIELLAVDAQWRRMSEIADALGLQKGPAHRLLHEMAALGWVEQDTDTERYRLTLKLALLGQQYLRGTGLSGLVQPILDKAASQCHEFVALTVVQGNALHWFASSQGAPPGLMYQPSLSGRAMLYTTANGKVWLSTMSDEEAIRLALKNGLGRSAREGEAVGPRALRTVDEMLRELAATRARGYGVADEEAARGVRAIAVAVRAFDDQRVVATMSVAGPLLRMDPARDQELSALLQQTASTLGMVWPRNGPPQEVMA
jgi:DNA-binding IclR family transcriptional regulator